jgi:hypothetical protein
MEQTNDRAVTYDKWAKEKARVRSDFDAYMADVYGDEQSGISPDVFAKLLDAWNWSAIRTLESAATVAENTYEGSCCGDDGDSGYDFNGERSAQELRELADEIYKAIEAAPENGILPESR